MKAAGIRLVIVGAGGFGRGVEAWARASPVHAGTHSIEQIQVIDDRARSELLTHVASSIRDFRPGSNDRVLVAVGDPTTRHTLTERLQAIGAKFHAFVDDRATLGARVRVDEGTIVCPGTVISSDVSIARHVHINFNCSIGHDVHLGAFTTLSPAVNVMGEVEIGESVFLGGSATVLPRLRLGTGARVGAGAVVVRDVHPRSTVVGVPARPMPEQGTHAEPVANHAEET